MTKDVEQGDYGWFQYDSRDFHRPRHTMGVDLPLPRRDDDPPLVIWQQHDDRWVVDDAERDTYYHIHGFDRDQVIAAVRFAWAMDWISPHTTRPALLRRIDDADDEHLIG